MMFFLSSVGEPLRVAQMRVSRRSRMAVVIVRIAMVRMTVAARVAATSLQGTEPVSTNDPVPSSAVRVATAYGETSAALPTAMSAAVEIPEATRATAMGAAKERKNIDSADCAAAAGTVATISSPVTARYS